MFIWERSPSDSIVQLIVRSDINSVTRSKNGLADGKIKVGVENTTGVLDDSIAVVVDMKVEVEDTDVVLVAMCYVNM